MGDGATSAGANLKESEEKRSKCKMCKERRRGKHVALRAHLLSTEADKRFSPRQRSPAAPTMPPILRADIGEVTFVPYPG